MAWTPWNVGDTHIPWQGVCRDDDGKAVDITGATLTMRFKGAVKPAFTGAGVFTIPSLPQGAEQGLFSYKLASTDVDTADVYLVQAVATYADATIAKSDAQTVTMIPGV